MHVLILGKWIVVGISSNASFVVLVIPVTVNLQFIFLPLLLVQVRAGTFVALLAPWTNCLVSIPEEWSRRVRLRC